MATVISQLAIGAADRKADALRVELWRTVSSVGTWIAYLRNTGGQYNGVFDVQDQFLVDINGLANTLMQGRVDGPAVTLRGQDSESDWDEYVILKGVDQTQDLLFHNDFDYSYPDAETAAQTLHSVWNNVINIRLAGLTNITYVPPAFTPAVGSIEFKEGTNFLATTQELFSRAGYIFYVDDTLAFRSGAPGFSASGVILNSVAGLVTNNIVDVVDLQERDGDKHYNYVKFYGKNPMFDGYTEYNSPSWTFTPAGNGLDDTGTVRVGSYSQVSYNTNAGAMVDTYHRYTLPNNNHTSLDFTKGELGVWARYDNDAGAPGTPQAGDRVNGTPGFPNDCWLWVRLTDGAARTADYFGDSTRLYIDNWGWCSFPLGERGGNVALLANTWFLSNPAFDWSNITAMWFHLYEGGASVTFESHLYLDGITMPEPCIAVSQNLVAQGTYRRRPYVDYLQHINTQNALVESSAQFLAQVESTSINKVSLVAEGNLALRYAGQSITVNIPLLGLNSEVMYVTQLHHIIEPYKDVSGGFGLDWITEIEAVPTSGVAYDMSRLRGGSMNSSRQEAARAGTGLRIK